MTTWLVLGLHGGNPANGSMIRWLMVGTLLIGLGTGLRRGWISVEWKAISEDLNMPFLIEKDPLKQVSDDLYRGNSSDKQAR